MVEVTGPCRPVSGTLPQRSRAPCPGGPAELHAGEAAGPVRKAQEPVPLPPAGPDPDCPSPPDPLPPRPSSASF